eukprot:GHVU01061479.1.p1 GENE.GHVU01061479.1~~GHVU01061479.1.p1  ORF type:complete len:265 (+),score=68.23 GHVU01061479.1:1952-2746(+)
MRCVELCRRVNEVIRRTRERELDMEIEHGIALIVKRFDEEQEQLWNDMRNDDDRERSQPRKQGSRKERHRFIQGRADQEEEEERQRLTHRMAEQQEEERPRFTQRVAEQEEEERLIQERAEEEEKEEERQRFILERAEQEEEEGEQHICIHGRTHEEAEEERKRLIQVHLRLLLLPVEETRREQRQLEQMMQEAWLRQQQQVQCEREQEQLRRKQEQHQKELYRQYQQLPLHLRKHFDPRPGTGVQQMDAKKSPQVIPAGGAGW